MAHDDMEERSESASDVAVLMLGFGGPGKLEDVRPFVENVVRGRNVPPERVDAVVEQYKMIGGKSPFNELTERQAVAVADELSRRRSLSVSIHPAMLFWHPYVEDVVAHLVHQGTRRVVALVMAPHRSEASFDRYRNRLMSAMSSLRTDGSNADGLSVEFVKQWHTEPLFVSAAASRVKEALDRVPSEARSRTRVFFTAHSIPAEMSGSATYAAQIEESARAVAESLAIVDWGIAYQSRSGSPRQSWLEPDIRDAICAAGKDGRQAVVVMPLGFVCDHVEVLFDLDLQAKSLAEDIGIRFVRAETVGTHPDFVALLSERILDAIALRNWLPTSKAKA